MPDVDGHAGARGAVLGEVLQRQFDRGRNAFGDTGIGAEAGPDVAADDAGFDEDVRPVRPVAGIGARGLGRCGRRAGSGIGCVRAVVVVDVEPVACLVAVPAQAATNAEVPAMPARWNIRRRESTFRSWARPRSCSCRSCMNSRVPGPAVSGLCGCYELVLRRL